MKKNRIVTLILLLFVFTQVMAFDFVANRIVFVGLHHIPASTALNYLPVKPGDRITNSVSDNIIQSLYKTGFFENVSLSRQGNTLIITVQEQPTIGKITLSGNKVIKSNELLSVLRKMHIAEGYEYNKSSLKEIKSALLSQYYAHGKYNARVQITTQALQNNRVQINIVISEGVVSTIKQIQIIGNHHFSERTLLGQFQLSTPGIFSWYTHDDEYSSEKLGADLENLQNFYLNHGYLKIKIDSAQVSLSPDRKHVYIVVQITEGPQYHFSGYTLSGKLILPKQKLSSFVDIKPGDIYSKQALVDAEKNMGLALGDLGYANAQIVPHPQVDEKNHTVFINFEVKPGRRVYVRQITFTGNTHTDDFAMRRALTQMEGELASTRQLRNSKQQLMQMPFIKQVEMTTKPVSGQTNEEDVNYNVTTYPGGEIQAGVGYSDTDGFLINASLTQQNFYGTGNQFSINASRSNSTLNAGVSYYNPYYTTWGVGRGFNLYASHFNASKQNIADYGLDNYGGTMTYSIPFTLHDSFQVGMGLDYDGLHLSDDPSTVMSDFENKHGKNFTQLMLNAGWTHNGLNRSVFPTLGLYQNFTAAFAVPVGTRSLEYYTGDYNVRYFHPIYHSFVFAGRAEVGYGDGYGRYNNLPFFKNFYAGGMGSVAGYVANTIGPQDNQGNSIGGNLLVTGRLGIIFPNPLSRMLRTQVFVDGGNVYNTHATKAENDANKDRSGLRYSAGLEVDWLTPFAGILKFSVAQAINPSSQDDTTLFQFNIGTSF